MNVMLSTQIPQPHKICTMVWEKFMVGNIHENKIRGKKSLLSRLQTNYFNAKDFYAVVF